MLINKEIKDFLQVDPKLMYLIKNIVIYLKVIQYSDMVLNIKCSGKLSMRSGLKKFERFQKLLSFGAMKKKKTKKKLFIIISIIYDYSIISLFFLNRIKGAEAEGPGAKEACQSTPQTQPQHHEVAILSPAEVC